MSEHNQIITALRSMRFDADPSEEFKALLRVRLVAVAGLGAPVAVTDRSPGTAIAAFLRGWIRSTRTIAAMATMSVVLAALGVMVIAGRDALPGDALYGTKRAVEQVQLALASSPSDAAFTRLGFAEERLWEIKQLLGTPEALGPGTGPTAAPLARSARMVGLINETLDSMDRDIRDSTKTLVTQGNKSALASLQVWSTKQRSALMKLASRLPIGSAARAKTSTALLTQVDTRARVRQTDVDKPCATSRSDALGTVPCDAPVSSPVPTDTATKAGSSAAASAGSPGVTVPQPSPSPPSGQSGSSAGPASPGSGGSTGGSGSQTGSPAQPSANPGSSGTTVTGNPTPPASSTADPPASDDPVGQPSEPVIVEPNPAPAPEPTAGATQAPAPGPVGDALTATDPEVASSSDTTCVVDVFGVCVG